MSAPKPQSFAEALEARPSDQLAGSLAATSVRFAPETWSEEDGSFEAVLNTGAWVDRWSYARGAYKLRLGVGDGQVDLGRANAGGPVLDSHNSWQLRDQIGVIVPGSARVVEGVGIVARVRLSSRPEVAGIRQDVRDGIIRNGSVGAQIQSTTVDLVDGMEWHTATSWSLLEFSLVSVPADAGAQVLSARMAERMEEATMATETPTAPAVEIDHEALRAEARAEGARLEATRQTEIRSAAARLKLAGDSPELAKLLADPSVSVDKAREAIIELRAQADEKGPRTSPHISMGRTEGEHFAKSAENALLAMFGHKGVNVDDDERARQFMSRGPFALAETCLRKAGVETAELSRTEVAKRAIRMQTGGVGVTGFAMSTSDFPLILSNVANKRMQAGYAAELNNFAPFCRRRDLPNFKAETTVQYSGAPGLKDIVEGGEYTYSTMTEGSQTWRLTKRGRLLALTWEALINDDLRAFDEAAFQFGGAAIRKEKDVVWAIITGNPTMGDGFALFSTEHENIVAAPDVPSVAQLDEMDRLIGMQVGLRGDADADDTEQLSLHMRFALVPRKLRLATMQALGLVQGYYPATASATIPSDFGFEVISEPRLDRYSTTKYFGVADPAQVPTIVYGYLQGEAGPVMESDMGFEVDAVTYKIRHVFGAGPEDHRGFVSNPDT